MSSKEDKKTKKKKTIKSAEGKSEDNVKAEPTVKEETVKEEIENKTDETADPVEDNTEKNKPTNGTPENQTEPVPDPKPEESIAKDTKDDRGSIKTDVKKGSKKKEKDVIKTTDIEKLVELKEAFSLFDFNHDGIIDLQDLKYTFASMGKPDYPEEEMQRMLKEATEPVDFDAFVALFGYKVSALDAEDVFANALATWDMRGVGMIPEANLKKDIRCFGDKFSGKDTDTALEEAPVRVDEGISMIDYLKFSNNICGFKNVERTRRYQKELENPQAQK